MTKPKDETLDGPRIAAEILKRLPAKDQARLVKAIQNEEPQIAAQIEANLYNFDDITSLTPKSIQFLISQIDHRDLVISLKTASQGVKNVLLTNMTERKRKNVEDDFSALPQLRISEVEAAQRRILDKLEDFRKEGKIHSGDKKDVYA